MIVDLNPEEIEFLLRMCRRAKGLQEILKYKTPMGFKSSDMDKFDSLIEKFKSLSNDH